MTRRRRARSRSSDDRNVTVHTYNEEVARASCGRLGVDAALLRVRIEAVRARVGG